MVPAVRKDKVFALGQYGPKRPHTLTKGGRRTWEQNLEKLRRLCCGQIITVEFDGERIKTEGGFEL